MAEGVVAEDEGLELHSSIQQFLGSHKRSYLHSSEGHQDSDIQKQSHSHICNSERSCFDEAMR